MKFFWVNTFSFYFIVSELVDLFKLIRRGNIIAVSSNLTKLVNNDTAAYIGAKAALEKITVQLAYQLGEYNICCNIICPGFFFSAMSNNIPLKVLEEIKKNTPLNQVVTEETIATVILDILCSKNLGMTGQIITVDGGNTIGFAKN
ncbi:SDR family NAD(P)-dependent oxidoreductase [Sellimonas intestinalis]|uniref:SDR family NAD(P)-dependent oxidoreductase n=1 Tax=Sellimonas intestinalis TaxID=1653434 RepID=UPI00399C12E1